MVADGGEAGRAVRVLFERVPLGVIVISPAGVLRWANGGALALVGRAADEIVGRPLTDLLHPDDRPLWELTHTDRLWDVDLGDGFEIVVGGTLLRAIHTPGHAPGAVCFHAPELGCVFTGDTLFQGGPGATGRSFSDEDQIKESIRSRLFALGDDTVVHTGHGDDTTIGAERAGLDG